MNIARTPVQPISATGLFWPARRASSRLICSEDVRQELTYIY
jgi:hypothetical protein